MQCPDDGTLRIEAVPTAAGMTYAGEAGMKPPKPFFCAPKTDEPYTGHWDYMTNAEVRDAPAKNDRGRTDVEGCCWWGRGSIQVRGRCGYGRLNHYLGKGAADGGRKAMYPDVDFCKNPGAVCDGGPEGEHTNLKWTAGMFKWIFDVQNFVATDQSWSYLDHLRQFVDGGFKDWSFVHRVSGLVLQGCHEPPCYEGAEFDGAERKATFIKTLKLFGFSVPDEGAAVETGRRLMEDADEEALSSFEEELLVTGVQQNKTEKRKSGIRSRA